MLSVITSVVKVTIESSLQSLNSVTVSKFTLLQCCVLQFVIVLVWCVQCYSNMSRIFLPACMLYNNIPLFILSLSICPFILNNISIYPSACTLFLLSAVHLASCIEFLAGVIFFRWEVGLVKAEKRNIKAHKKQTEYFQFSWERL